MKVTFLWTALLLAACKPALVDDPERPCPDYGLAQSGTPEAAANKIRNAKPQGKPVERELTFSEIEKIQLAADRRHILQGIAIANREAALAGFELGEKQKPLGEGSIVQVKGFIIGTPRVSRTDRANCNRPGEENNNYVFNLGKHAGDTEFDTIVAVVTPNGRRDKKCDLNKLRSIARDGRLIRVTGQLFYDSKRRVNSDPDNELAGEPRRLSLWEIHPVTAIDICRSRREETCRGGTARYEPLEEVR